jgi:hypothetical protein
MKKKPTYNLSTSLNDDIVEIVITGELEKKDLQKFVNEISAILKSMNANKFLADIRELKGRYSYVEAYSYVRNYPPHFRIKTAVVDIPENADFEDFHETTANNAGLPLKWFTDIDKARAWLKGK